jgi:predicted amidohydrolase
MKLTVAAVQYNICWHNKTENFLRLETLLQNVNADIIVLPEMFQTGFSMESEKLAEKENDQTLQWMQKTAKEKKAALLGSFIVEENNHYYNRFFWVNPDGNYYTYNKRHLFRMAQEHHYFTSGNALLTVNYKGFKFLPLICYDLRFPVWSRNVKNKKPIYDCLIYVANWPEPRTHAWSKLLEARAIENLCYVIGVNRCGTDGNNINYKGNSAIIDFKGNSMQTATPFKEEIIYATIDLQKLNEFREKFPAFLDADDFELKI